MTACEIIVALGGRLKVAEITGAKPNAVTQWYRAGIPAKFWPDLLDEAKKVAPGLTVDALRATNRQRCEQRPGAASQAAA